MDLQLQQHVAVVTGGANGIGRATAEGFAAEGAAIALWDISESVEHVAAEMAHRFKVPVLPVPVDLASEPAVAQATAATLAAFKHIDHLVHCAAMGSGKFGYPFTNLTPSDWPRVLQVNVLGMVHVAHALAKPMIARKTGTMIFLASVAGQIGSQTDPPYSASKAANINFAQCLAKDLATHGIRVNTVCPGMVPTALNRSVWQAWYHQAPLAERLSFEEWSGRKLRSMVPLGEWQTPQAVADMIVFLSSERAAHVTGQTINVDGGFVMHW